jgi:hypothetical protein
MGGIRGRDRSIGSRLALRRRPRVELAFGIVSGRRRRQVIIDDVGIRKGRRGSAGGSPLLLPLLA